MDIYDYLKWDHEQVSQLFKQFEKSDLEVRKKQIMALIAQELLIHAQSEQETFYQTLENYPETRDVALHGREEHQEITDLINLIVSANKFGAAWEKKVIELKNIVEHHVNEEEGEIFKKAKKVLSEDDAYILKEKMHYLKQQLLLKNNFNYFGEAN